MKEILIGPTQGDFPMPGELLIEGDVAARSFFHEERAGGLWHALQTRVRQEKALGLELSAMGLANVLPMICQERYFGRRRAVVEVPVFPGVVFIQGDQADLDLAYQTMRVLQTIKVADQESLHWTLDNLRLLSQWPVELTACAVINCGRRVEVASGPLRGVQGLMGENGDRLVFQVEGSPTAVGVKLSGQTLSLVA